MILKHQGSAQGPPTSVSVWLPHEGIDVSFIRQAGLLGKDRRPSEGPCMSELDLANQIQAILHLKLSNTKDFDRGCRNAKYFGSRPSKYKIFCIRDVCADFCACADSCVLTRVCVPTAVR
jgi:hypothetical protein